MRSLTLIASTGERFGEFAPYVASVDDAGTVAFQAGLRAGGSGVFSGSGGQATELVAPPLLAGVTSHPDLNNAGDVSFYGELADGTQAVFLLRDGRLETIADTLGPFAAIGPLGPTMNEAGVVAFRADTDEGVSGIFTGDGAGTVTVADTAGPWIRFHGLPVLDDLGTVVFRADRKDGTHGIYAARSGSIDTVVETEESKETLGLFPTVDATGAVAFATNLTGGGAGVSIAAKGRITPTIGPDGPFETCRGALISGTGTVIVVGTPRGGRLGLFDGSEPETDRILEVGHPLFDSTVADFAANPVSVNALGQLAVRATLADDSQVILRADPAG